MAAADVMKAVGVQYVDPYQRETSCCEGEKGRFDFSLEVSPPTAFMDVSGYDVINAGGYANLSQKGQEPMVVSVTDKGRSLDVKTTATERGVEIQVGAYPPLTFDVQTPVQALVQKRREGGEFALVPIEVAQAQGGLKGKLVVTSVSGQYQAGQEATLEGFSYRLLIRFP